jgi:hypothetical protein
MHFGVLHWQPAPAVCYSDARSASCVYDLLTHRTTSRSLQVRVAAASLSTSSSLKMPHRLAAPPMVCTLATNPHHSSLANPHPPHTQRMTNRAIHTRPLRSSTRLGSARCAPLRSGCHTCTHAEHLTFTHDVRTCATCARVRVAKVTLPCTMPKTSVSSLGTCPIRVLLCNPPHHDAHTVLRAPAERTSFTLWVSGQAQSQINTLSIGTPVGVEWRGAFRAEGRARYMMLTRALF